ncbi:MULTISPECIES: retropepsin-like aspartic protease family protein [Idiomarina]|jgi:aspartyl protease family protein|uniref:Predicted aspartyl protease n=1 Tax=Idiomarina baltica OS145 TaxID=314276 RepID=A0ABP2CTP5_9GAMM|nr:MULTISPECIES: retropepsin-like aspartic protease [Idiomarina]EAQ32239.1 Predicted aspartyl protease [Idiomarina baltica OS145]MAD53355.1 TIGR02281 family clan AA aspartic protease [Idiomarinaceae bacterium]MEC9318813.1 retropepsin-like aspartic protease [Pseudomonadota bacterium]NQZ04725.1 retroviral-like aspartic protease family protein [Idiomarina sp.]|tara:strand:- start:11445 stop:11948 length:504 start_codon:yes stop_codon:yes gene_type:complete
MSSTQGFGKTFSFIAWGLALALLVWFFQDKLEQQFNPNQDVVSQRLGGQTVVELTQNRMGHYVVSGKINQQPVTFLLDTGATLVAIPQQVADRLGLVKGRKGISATANGRIVTYRTHLNTLTLGGITLNNVDASITPGLEDDVILLGMSALKQMELVQKGDTLTIKY